MKPDDSTRDKIGTRDLDRIRELPSNKRIRWSGYGRAIAFGGLCFALGLWIGRDTGRKIRIETFRQADAMPVLFAARGTTGIRRSMFSIVAMPKPARLVKISAEIGHRRPLTVVPAPIVKNTAKKDKKGGESMKNGVAILQKGPAPVKKTVVAQKKQPEIAAKTAKNTKNGFYSLQVRAYKDRAEAMAFFNQLKSRGYGVWAELYRDPSGVTWTRIFVGRFRKHESAVRFRARFKKMQSITGLVVFKERPAGHKQKRGGNAKTADKNR